MADSKVALARARLKELAAGVTADELTIEEGNIHLGCKGAAEEFAAEAAFVAGEPVLVIGSASMGFSGTYYPLIVDCELAVPLDGNAAQDWTNVDNLVAALRAEWLDQTNYPEGEVKPGQCDYDRFACEVRGDVTVVRVPLFVTFESPDA
jgi:hypothetical protein